MMCTSTNSPKDKTGSDIDLAKISNKENICLMQ